MRTRRSFAFLLLALTSCAASEETDNNSTGTGGTGGASGDSALDNGGGGEAGGTAGAAGSTQDGGDGDASGGTAGSALDGSVDGSADAHDSSFDAVNETSDDTSTDVASDTFDDGAAGAPSDSGADASDAAPDASCTDACSLGDNTCVVGGLAPCEQGPSGCRTWGTPVACASNETCVTDACIPTGPVQADVQIYIDNFCNVTIAPPSFDVAAGETLRLTYHNNSVDYEADIWASYGGGYLGLATGGTWAETFEYCSMPGEYTAYVDININGGPFPSCPGTRLYIYCH